MDNSTGGSGYSYADAANFSNIPRQRVAPGSGYATNLRETRDLRDTNISTLHTSDSSYLSDLTRLSDRQATMLQGAWESGGRARTLPEYSRKYSNIGRAGPSTFFVPSYLKDSRYATKLEAAYAAKSRAHREGSSSTPSMTSNTTNIPRMTPSHRGMTYDIVESNPPREEDEITPLPTRWNNQDRHPGLDVTNEGVDLRYNGSVGKAETEAASIRADYPMSPACGMYYFEVEIKQKSKDCLVAIGFSTQKASLERLPGWEAESWAYHGDDGKAFSGEQHGQDYGQPFVPGDTIGCGLNFNTGQAFFTRNGIDLGIAFRELKDIRPFPSIGVKKSSGAVISVNFGQRPFLFDIDDRAEAERIKIRREIRKTRTTPLNTPIEEHAMVQDLVSQFLSHGGYVETAKAFAEQRMSESNALDKTVSMNYDHIDADRTNAIYRQEIRCAILTGDIDRALLITEQYFPTVLETSPGIVFRLKCRKWVELISRASDLRARQFLPAGSRHRKRSSNGFHADSPPKPSDEEEQPDHHMELDEDDPLIQSTDSKTSILTEDTDMAYNQLLTEAMNYGQILQKEYRDETNPEYRKALENIFSLVAYDEPRESVHGHLLDNDGRVKVAEELNSAILVSLGRAPTAALENAYRQTEALIDVLSQDGGPASFVNLKSDFNS